MTSFTATTVHLRIAETTAEPRRRARAKAVQGSPRGLDVGHATAAAICLLGLLTYVGAWLAGS